RHRGEPRPDDAAPDRAARRRRPPLGQPSDREAGADLEARLRSGSPLPRPHQLRRPARSIGRIPPLISLISTFLLISLIGWRTPWLTIRGAQGGAVMTVTTSYPGVYIDEIPSGVRTITGVATSVTAFIGRAERGPTDAATLIHSFAEFQRIFGAYQ